MKPLAILKQAGFDPGNVRDISAAEPERISDACGPLLWCSLSRCGAGAEECSQRQNASDEYPPLLV
jgi:hypothetical protein